MLNGDLVRLFFFQQHNGISYMRSLTAYIRLFVIVWLILQMPFLDLLAMFFEVVLALLLTCLVLSITNNYLSRRTLPPGPFPLPIIGNLFSAGDDAPFTMDYLGEKYGDLYTLTFPIGNFVVVNNGELLHEAFVKRKDDFAGRPGTEFFPLKSIFEGTKEVLNNNI